MTPQKVVLVGAGGYAALYIRILLDPKMAGEAQLIAIVDPYAAASPSYEQIKHLPIYDDLSQFFANHQADLAIISSPIQLHFEQCMTALENGANVLCEKPLVPTVAQLDTLAEKARAVGKTLAVGFQLSYATFMTRLKQRIMSGEFGKPLSLKAYVSWPRDWAYYGRNAWAGKRKTADGKLVNDAVVSNATAHYLHNMLFMLGDTMAQAAPLTGLEAECYRANDIETFDTTILRGQAAGADIFYTATHASDVLFQPLMEYTFEKARIQIEPSSQGDFGVIYYNDGRVEKLGESIHDGDWNKVALTLKKTRGQYPVLCDVETVRPITAILDDIFANVPVAPFDGDFVVQDVENKATYVKGLHEDLLTGHRQGKLPSEMGFGWRGEA